MREAYRSTSWTCCVRTGLFSCGLHLLYILCFISLDVLDVLVAYVCGPFSVDFRYGQIKYYLNKTETMNMNSKNSIAGVLYSFISPMWLIHYSIYLWLFTVRCEITLKCEIKTHSEILKALQATVIPLVTMFLWGGQGDRKQNDNYSNQNQVVKTNKQINKQNENQEKNRLLVNGSRSEKLSKSGP